jgi:hypothetical protein
MRFETLDRTQHRALTADARLPSSTARSRLTSDKRTSSLPTRRLEKFCKQSGAKEAGRDVIKGNALLSHVSPLQEPALPGYSDEQHMLMGSAQTIQDLPVQGIRVGCMTDVLARDKRCLLRD